MHDKMVEFANRGFRSLGLAKADGDGLDKSVESKWEFVGMIPLFDPPRHDTKDTIERCHQQARTSVSFSGYFGKIKLTLRPAGHSKHVQIILGGWHKIQGFLVLGGGLQLIY